MHYEVSFQLMASSQISTPCRDGVCEESAVLLMSSFHLTFIPPVALYPFTFGSHATECLSCWTWRPRRRTNGCYSDVRGSIFSDCLYAVDMIAQPFSLLNSHRVMNSHFLPLFVSAQIRWVHVCAREARLPRCAARARHCACDDDRD